MPRVELIPIYLIPGKVWDQPIPVTPKAGSYGEKVATMEEIVWTHATRKLTEHPIFLGSAGTAEGSTSSTSKVSVISITGKGIANLVGLMQTGLGVGYVLSFTIDGVEKSIEYAANYSAWSVGYDDTPNKVIGKIMLPFTSSFSLNGRVSAGTGRYFMTYVLFSRPVSEKKWTERVDDTHDKEIIEYYDEKGKLLHRIECLRIRDITPPVEFHPLERILRDLERIKAKLGIE